MSQLRRDASHIALGFMWGVGVGMVALIYVDHLEQTAGYEKPGHTQGASRVPVFTARKEPSMKNLRNLFGEPAAIVGAIQAALVMALAFGWLDGLGLHSQNDIATLVLVLNGLAALYLAFITHETLLAPVIEVFKAIVALGVIYGFHITTEQTGLVIAFLTAMFALAHRTQTSPLAKGSFTLAA